MSDNPYDRYKKYGQELVDRINLNSLSTTKFNLEEIPLYVLAAQVRADRINAQKIPGSPDLTYLDVLEGDKRRVLTSTYPGPNCLNIAELLEIGASGTVTQEVLDHLTACAGCQGYLPVTLEELEVQRPEAHNSWPIETNERTPWLLMFLVFVLLSTLLTLWLAVFK